MKKTRVYVGCLPVCHSPETYESLKEMLNHDRLEKLVHKKDIEFMRLTVENYEKKMVGSVIKELSTIPHGKKRILQVDQVVGSWSTYSSKY